MLPHEVLLLLAWTTYSSNIFEKRLMISINCQPTWCQALDLLRDAIKSHWDRLESILLGLFEGSWEAKASRICGAARSINLRG